jgi:copper homeostasis protein
MPTLEVCIDNIEEAIAAIAKGAHQLEVCASLDQDGLTPSYEMTALLAKQTTTDLSIMIRSRGGDFNYTVDEVQAMISQINPFKSLRIKGFVIGATKRDENGATILDISAIIQLCRACHPYPVTIHKCIDTCTDIIAECIKLKSISNVAYVLSSGGKPTAVEGTSMLLKMKETLGPEIQVIGAGKITKENLLLLDRELGLQYYHGRKIVG